MNTRIPADLPEIEAGDPAARTALVLHGGGGPRTVAPIVAHLGATMHAVAPTHPGWEGTNDPTPSAPSRTSPPATSTACTTAASTGSC